MSYFQDTEYGLLQQLLSRLENRTVLDVGAEKGTFVEACLAAGSARVYAFDPYPPHADLLRRKFAETPEVTVCDLAIGAADRSMELHIAHDRSGQPLDYHHSLVEFDDARDVQWRSAIPVSCRSLDSLAAEGSIPPVVGMLKIDTEGGDLLVLEGAGAIESAVVVAECWKGLSESIADSPYQASEIAELLESRGYRDYVLVKRHDEFESLQVNSTHLRDGDWGNLVFVHEALRDELAPLLWEASASGWDRLTDRALWFRGECEKRLELIESLDRALKQASNGPTSLRQSWWRRLLGVWQDVRSRRESSQRKPSE